MTGMSCRSREIEQSGQILAHPAVGAEDLSSKVQMKRRSSFGSKPAVAPQVRTAPAGAALERGHPGIAAGEVDDDVDAAIEAAAMRLAVLVVDPFHEILVRVVDDVVCAELFQARSLSALDAHTMTSAPASFASCTQQVPTPPEAPRISTFSPACTWPMVSIMRSAVP